MLSSLVFLVHSFEYAKFLQSNTIKKLQVLKKLSKFCNIYSEWDVLYNSIAKQKYYNIHFPFPKCSDRKIMTYRRIYRCKMSLLHETLEPINALLRGASFSKNRIVTNWKASSTQIIQEAHSQGEREREREREKARA